MQYRLQFKTQRGHTVAPGIAQVENTVGSLIFVAVEILQLGSLRQSGARRNFSADAT